MAAGGWSWRWRRAASREVAGGDRQSERRGRGARFECGSSLGQMNKALAKALLQRAGVDAGRDRDQELVAYVGRHGIVTIPDVMKAMGVGRTVAYRRAAVCIEAGLLERLEILRSVPPLLRATREGLQYVGLGLPLAEVSPGAVNHWLHCVSTAHVLCEHFGTERVLTEREVALIERVEDRPIASAKVGTLPNGSSRLHRPDLAVITESGILSVEVELTPKSPTRLAKIMRAWRAASWVSEVNYVSPPGPTFRAVKRAIAATGAKGKVKAYKGVPGS